MHLRVIIFAVLSLVTVSFASPSYVKLQNHASLNVRQATLADSVTCTVQTQDFGFGIFWCTCMDADGKELRAPRKGAIGTDTWYDGGNSFRRQCFDGCMGRVGCRVPILSTNRKGKLRIRKKKLGKEAEFCCFQCDAVFENGKCRQS